MNMGVDPPFKIRSHKWEILSIVETCSSISQLKDTKREQLCCPPYPICLLILFGGLCLGSTPSTEGLGPRQCGWAVTIIWEYLVGRAAEESALPTLYLFLHFHSQSSSVGNWSLPCYGQSVRPQSPRPNHHLFLGISINITWSKHTAFILFSKSSHRNQAADYTCQSP